ncbi:hypothetical protein N7468_004534 [Penicillium chermesinum]|uniref:GAF domain-containing protein n=1 Tax=Penicillium chermesinum TaxID=63820 RepID=A0A9W9P8P9_9EURO|nr:uncharacterized protein N7468_004534 [Penicillium chermesinum]KAJ5239915.1 hypothetical protein N7468_004534 [Penicillium chermesinum]
MPHADSSYFLPGQSKAEVYTQVLEQAQGLLHGQRNWVHTSPNFKLLHPNSPSSSNLSNVSSLLWHAFAALPAPSSSVNWAGFYIRDDKFPVLASPISSPPLSAEDQVLLLGPFHGKPACQEIRFGKGVCGTAAANKKTLIVPDVLEFPGHIACDAESRSEIVVPILVRGETVAIIDIDCVEPSGFDEEDQKYLEQLAAILADSCDW